MLCDLWTTSFTIFITNDCPLFFDTKLFACLQVPSCPLLSLPHPMVLSFCKFLFNCVVTISHLQNTFLFVENAKSLHCFQRNWEFSPQQCLTAFKTNDFQWDSQRNRNVSVWMWIGTTFLCLENSYNYLFGYIPGTGTHFLWPLYLEIKWRHKRVIDLHIFLSIGEHYHFQTESRFTQNIHQS